MANDELIIELEGNGTELKTGEAIRGKLIAAVGVPRKCHPLKIVLEWSANGDIYGSPKTVAELELPGGEWEADGRYEYPFELAPVFGPLSYQGKHFSVTWTLQAHARLSPGPDISQTTNLSLVPGNDRSNISLGPEIKQPIDPNFGDERLGIAVGIVAMLLFFIPSFFLLKPGAMHFFFQQGPIPKELLDRMGASVFLILIGCLISYFVVRRLLAFLKLGRVVLEIDSQELRAGERISGAVRFTPSREVRISHLTATMHAEEYSRRAGNQNSGGTRFVHELFRKEEVLCKDLTLSRNVPHCSSFVFTVPENAVPSFMASRHKINWRILIHAELPGWSSYNHEIELLVRPPAR